MGSKSSKVVITPENQSAAACAPEGTIKPLNPPGENGSADGISSVDAVASESDHNGDVQPADATVSTLPAIEEGGEQKKKSDPLKWIQKKISFKKTKAPKKSEKELAPVESTQLPVETAQEEEEVCVPKEKEPVAAVGDVEVQSEEITKMDQATAANPETGVAESSGEPVVEITPTSNGVQVKVGSEEFIEEPPSCFNGGEKNGLVEVPEDTADESKISVGLSEKLANLGIEPATNGLESHAVNGSGGVAVSSEEN